MGVLIGIVGLSLLVISTSLAHGPPTLSGGCPYAHSAALDAAEAFSKQKRHSPSYEVRPAVINERNLDALIKTFLPKYTSSSMGQSSWSDNKPATQPIRCGIAPSNCLNNTQNLYYRSADGSCNNLLYPDFGIASARYRRLLRPSYMGQGYTVPNARLISLSMYGEKTYMDKFRTVASMQFGQFVSHDISLLTTQGAPRDCCEKPNHPLCQPITLAAGGPIAYNTGKTCLHFARSISDADAICPKSNLPHSEKLSVVTAYLDLSSVYGSTAEEARNARTFKAGQLRTSFANGQQWMPVSLNEDGQCGQNNECYSLPDRRNRFTPTVAVVHTIFLREHNRLAEQLALLNPHYNDERLYQEARKINIAQYQRITYYEWLGVVLGSNNMHLNGLTYAYSDDNTEYVNDYDEGVNAGPYAEFASAAFRYAHHHIPGWFSLVAPNRYSNQTLRLSDFFENPETIRLLQSNYNFADLVRGMATQLQKRTDGHIDREIKHYFNRKIFEDFGSDLKAIDIQRARDFGLASYNDARELCGLRRAQLWEDLEREVPKDKISMLRKLYVSPEEVELSVGGTVEFHVPDSIFGPTLHCIISKQFLNLRRGDRFFFERENHLSGFSRGQLAEIRKTSLAGLFCNNVQGLHDIQPNVFIFPNSRNTLLSCHEIPQTDLTKWQDLSPQLIN
ncbi:CG4009 [Drosophila busckii]|uniref:CG4009 n=1 Tax=Drosophila busckii TaxID=30019 RepID=A0A0M4EKH0_DROBS|nr:peroxidase [Drosophila busckii]ALC47696.1 CG4009 [Drosophila busckii]